MEQCSLSDDLRISTVYDRQARCASCWVYHLCIVAAVAIIATVPLSGCQSTQPHRDASARQRMLELLMPRTIEIVEPFTGIKNFDKDPEPDGIEILLQAINTLDNPGLMIVGTIRVELYQFVPGSAQRKGKWLDKWDVSLASPEDQRRYWNQATQMYEFRLGVDPQIIPLAKRYILTVTYNSPLGTRLTDECVIEFNKPGGPLGGA